MEKKTVYIETTVVSYLTARPTSDLVGAAWQAITTDWWETQRRRFDLRTSEVTVGEAGRGDAEAGPGGWRPWRMSAFCRSRRRLTSCRRRWCGGGAVPERAETDALHLAVAAVHGVDYLLTWNCRHLDNAETKPVMRRICGECGYLMPEVCTPQELMRGGDDG